MEKKIEFTMILNQFDEAVMKSFPQKLVSVKKSFFGSKIVVQNESTHLETESINFVKEKGRSRATTLLRIIIVMKANESTPQKTCDSCKHILLAPNV